MFLRKYWKLTISVFLVAIVGVSLYWLQTRPPKDPIVIYKPVELLPKKSTEPPITETPVVEQPQQGGHVPADGTRHEGPHDAHVKPPSTVEPPTGQAPDLQQYAGHIPEHLLEAQRLLAAGDPERARAAFRDALPEDPFSAEFEMAVKSAIQTAVDLHPIVYDLPPGDPRRVEDAIAHNLMMAAFDEAAALGRLFVETGNPIYRDRRAEIHSWKDPYYALIPEPAPMSDSDLEVTRKAAEEFDAIWSQTPSELDHLKPENPYRIRLQAEEKRRQAEVSR